MNNIFPVPGTPGYLRKKKSRLGLILILFAAVIALFLIIGYYRTGTRNNICTLIGVLLVLPAAKFVVTWLMLLPYHSIDPARYDEAAALAADADCILADLVLTRYEGRMYLPLVLVRGGHIFAAAPQQKMSRNMITDTLKNCMSGVKESRKTVRLFDDAAALTTWMRSSQGTGGQGTENDTICAALKSHCL